MQAVEGKAGFAGVIELRGIKRAELSIKPRVLDMTRDAISRHLTMDALFHRYSLCNQRVTRQTLGRCDLPASLMTLFTVPHAFECGVRL